MKDKIRIYLSINSVRHKLDIDPKLEPVYRKAERLLEKVLGTLKSRWKTSEGGDYISFAAFILAFNQISSELDSQNDDISNALIELSNKLELNDN